MERAQAGDQDAAAEVVRLMRRRIRSLVRRVMVDIPEAAAADLEQVGRVTVLEVLPLFEAERGVDFGTFAWPRVRKAVNRAAAVGHHGLGVPSTSAERYLAALRAADGDARAARDLWDRAPYEFDALRAAMTVASLDTVEGRVGLAVRSIPVEVDESLDRAALAHELVDGLDEPLRSFIRRVFFDGAGVAAAAAEAGVARRTGYKWLEKALTEMRGACTEVWP